MQIELCAFSIIDLLEINSTTRIELCSNYNEGGLSSYSLNFLQLRESLSNKIYVMIRPRGGDFHYSNEEFDIMKAEIAWFKENGADGIVLGLLNIDGSIDKQRRDQFHC